MSFADPGLTVAQVVDLSHRYARMGVARFCPTLITGPLDATARNLSILNEARSQDALTRHMIAGAHLEGPWISPVDGYRGAHPREHTREPRWDDFQRLQDTAHGIVSVVTLAPELPGALLLISKLADSGVLVAIGHTAADPETIRAAVNAGARLSTHLGNGIATPQPRHPNPIWTQAAEDRLSASLIADLAHLDADTLRVLTRAKGVRRTILVSDLGPLAGCAPGRYGAWDVCSDGRIVVAGTDYLAGAARPLFDGLATLVDRLGWSLDDAWKTASTNPAALLGRPTELCDPPDVVWIETNPLRLVKSRIAGNEFVAA